MSSLILFPLFADYERSIVSGLLEMPESTDSSWILKSPYGSKKAWGRTETLRLLTLLSREWKRLYPNGPKIRIGDISKPDASPFPPHASHTHGRSVDIKTRPLNIIDTEYKDQSHTKELAELFTSFGANVIIYAGEELLDQVSTIYYKNDHDTHFHIEVNPAGVPGAGDWIMLPNVVIPKNTINNKHSIGNKHLVSISSKFIGVKKQIGKKKNQNFFNPDIWFTTGHDDIKKVMFQIDDNISHNDIPFSSTVEPQKKQTPSISFNASLNKKYFWRVTITTRNNEKLRSRWQTVRIIQKKSGKITPLFFDKNDIQILSIHFTILTAAPKNTQIATLKKRLMKEVEDLNQSPETIKNNVRFHFKSISDYKCAQKLAGPLLAMSDIKKAYQRERWYRLINLNTEKKIIDPEAINIIIYDGYSEKRGFRSKSSYIRLNSNRPYILLDWKRKLTIGYFKNILKKHKNVIRYIKGNDNLLLKIE